MNEEDLFALYEQYKNEKKSQEDALISAHDEFLGRTPDAESPSASLSQNVNRGINYGLGIAGKVVDGVAGLWDYGQSAAKLLYPAQFQTPQELQQTLNDGVRFWDTTGRGAMSVAGAASFAPAGIPGIGLGSAAGAKLWDSLVSQPLGITQPRENDAELFFTEDVPVGMFSEIGGRGLSKLAGFGGKLTNLYDKEKALRTAISQNPLDELGNRAGNISEAIDEIRGTGVFDDPALSRSATPMTDLYNNLYGEAGDFVSRENSQIGKAGRRVGELVDSASGTVPFSEIDPRNIITPAEEASGSAAKAQKGVVKTEFEQAAKQVLGEPLFNEYVRAQKTLKTIHPLQNKPLYDGLSAKISEIETMLDNSPMTAREIFNKKVGWAKDAKYSGDFPEVSHRASAYRDLEGSARETLASMVPGDEFAGANSRFEALSNLEGPLDARRTFEVTGRYPNIFERGWNMVRQSLPEFARGELTMGDARTNIRRYQGTTLPQQIGEAFRSAQGGIEAMRPFIAPSIISAPEQSPVQAPSALSVSLNPQNEVVQLTQPIIPRHIDMINPQGISNLLLLNAPEQDAGPLVLQWKNVFASGDKRQIASFLGEVAIKFPDFPFPRGPITGLPSEFDIGDGKSRLFSPMDIMHWEDEIDRSPLREEEKALRVMALRKDGLVVPMTQRMNNLDASLSSENGAAVDNVIATYPFARRSMNNIGSRREP